MAGWLNKIGSKVIYELDYKNPVIYVILVESILGKLLVVPLGDTETIPRQYAASFPNAFSDGTGQAGRGKGCRVWYVNSLALGWSREM